MDWQSLISASLVNVVSNRTARALGLLGVVAFAILALQWNRLGERPPSMCELINDCQLRYGDLQRIQVALGQCGLSKSD
jgi:hypothetical protein